LRSDQHLTVIKPEKEKKKEINAVLSVRRINISHHGKCFRRKLNTKYLYHESGMMLKILNFASEART
jgi:hypothetical protein